MQLKGHFKVIQGSNFGLRRIGLSTGLTKSAVSMLTLQYSKAHPDASSMLSSPVIPLPTSAAVVAADPWRRASR
jgi:hypothetical protein